MGVIEKQIAKRRKEALEKDFYGVGQEIVKNLGKNDAYDNGTIRIKRDHYSQEYTGGQDNIEIFFKGNSVYIGHGNDYTGPYADDIKRYVPGEWEEALEGIAQSLSKKTGIKTKTQKKNELLADWGIQ